MRCDEHLKNCMFNNCIFNKPCRTCKCIERFVRFVCPFHFCLLCVLKWVSLLGGLPKSALSGERPPACQKMVPSSFNLTLSLVRTCQPGSFRTHCQSTTVSMQSSFRHFLHIPTHLVLEEHLLSTQVDHGDLNSRHRINQHLRLRWSNF